MARNARYAAEMLYFIDYWERIHRKITSLLPSQPNKLQDGVLVNLGLEEGPRSELFHGEWPCVLRKLDT